MRDLIQIGWGVALHALKDGYEVYGLIDAAGDSTCVAHKYGIKTDASGRCDPYHGRNACVGMDA
jgi:hypothetical protein